MDRPGKVFGFSRLHPDQDRLIVECFRDGKSVREAAGIANVSKQTVQARFSSFRTRDLHNPTCTDPRNNCHYCNEQIVGKKEYKRPTSRQSHMFCDETCYQNFRIVGSDVSLSRYLFNQLRVKGVDMSKKRAVTKTEIKSTGDLRGVLLETIQGVQAGTVDYKQGNTIASLSKAVLQSAKLDFEVFKFHEQVATDDTQKLASVSLEA